jgi:ankyrin repeat protein
MKHGKILLLAISTIITTSALLRASEIDTELVSQSFGGNVEKVKSLIKQGARLEVVAFETWTPLAAAADQGHLVVVQELIDAGADVNTPDGAGNTPLFYAAMKGRTEVAQMLVKKGGQINDWPKNKEYVLESVKKNGSSELFQLIESLR